MCDTMKEGYSFYYISATGIYASCSPVGGDWLGYIGVLWINRPDTRKAQMLLHHYPLMRLSKTFPKDNDNNRHPRQSFIYNTFLTDMLIYTVRVEYLLNHLSLVESC